MTDLHKAARQALGRWKDLRITGNCGGLDPKQSPALRAALAQQAEPDLSLCPQCNGPADNGHADQSRLTRTSARSAWPRCHNPLTT
jgi:hypothetical protein